MEFDIGEPSSNLVLVNRDNVLTEILPTTPHLCFKWSSLNPAIVCGAAIIEKLCERHFLVSNLSLVLCYGYDDDINN